jgi:hypothetical protein
MKKQSKEQNRVNDAIFLGTTTMRYMPVSLCEEDNVFDKPVTFAEHFLGIPTFADDPSIGDNTVYVYYHPEEDETVMTSVEGDSWGVAGVSAGFKGKVTLKTQTSENKS